MLMREADAKDCSHNDASTVLVFYGIYSVGGKFAAIDLPQLYSTKGVCSAGTRRYTSLQASLLMQLGHREFSVEIIEKEKDTFRVSQQVVSQDVHDVCPL
jgi:hypothetical protein